MNARKAVMLEFMQHIAATPDGALFEIGEMFEPVNGWRVYMRIGGKALAMSARDARGLADLFENMARRPEWAKQTTWVKNNVDTLRACALVVVRKNRDKEVPAGYAEAMPTAGSA